MGVDYKAYAVIGCEVIFDNIPVKKERVKTFRHDYPDDGEIRFDPKTGKALWKTIEYPEFVFEDDDGYTDDYNGKSKAIKLDNLRMFRGTDGEPTVLGIGIGDSTHSNGGENYEFMPLPDIESIKKKVKEILEPANMWEEETFGLYSILYCSY